MNEMNRKLVEKMEKKELTYGTVLTSGSPLMTEMMAMCGFDVLWLDMEHTANGVESTVANMMAARSGGTPAWVRVPWNDPVRVKPIIDMGADGIIFPFIRTVEEAQLAVDSMTFPPKGIRGYGPLRALDYGKITQEEFVNSTYRDCRRIIQIEHIDAVNNLEKIAAIEGIDAFIVGPNDLSGSIGKLGKMRDPEMMEIYRRVGSILKDSGKTAAIFTGGFNQEYIQEWIDMGYTMFFSSSDCGFAFEGANRVIDSFNAAFRSGK